MNKLLKSLCVLAPAILAACGGGGGGGPVESDPATNMYQKPADCDFKVTKFDGGEPDNEGVGESGSDGSDGDGIGAGGSLGQLTNAQVIVRNPYTLPEPQVFAQGFTDGQTGLATIELCGYNGPLEVEFAGGPGAKYYDENQRTSRDFPVGSSLRVRVPNTDRKFIGASPFTEAAVKFAESGSAPTSDSGNTVGKILTPKDAADTISTTNERVADILADQLPGIYRANQNDGRFTIVGLPISLNEENQQTADTLPNTNRGRYSAANAGLVLFAGTLLPNDLAPGITIAKQLADDLTDGKLDLVNADGCSSVQPTSLFGEGDSDSDGPGSGAGGALNRSVSILNEPCEGAKGTATAYSYETLWRAQSIATALISDEAGDAALRNAVTPVARYTSKRQRVYETAACVRANGSDCDPFITRTDARQIVNLDNKGRLKLTRDTQAGFGPGISWVTDIAAELVLPGPFVEVKIGSRGEVAALAQDRRSITYFSALPVYRVTGQERFAGTAQQALQQAIQDFSPLNIRLDQTRRALNFVLPPPDRTAPFARGSNAELMVTYSDGLVQTILANAQNAADPTNQITAIEPIDVAATSVVYDKFIAPGSASYTAGRELGQKPWFGPRRLFVLGRQGRVQVRLEGVNANAVELQIPGRVVQVASESKTHIYALNSDGQVFWINADQAGESLHTIVPVNIPEPVCWIARKEAIACKSGRVYQWPEQTERLLFRQPGAPDGSGQSTTLLPTGIGQPQPVRLGDRTPPIWRLNAVEEFEVRNPPGVGLDGSIITEGIVYLPVDGDPVDPDSTSNGARNLLTTQCLFNGDSGPQRRPYLEGWQIRRAFQSSLQGLSERSRRVSSSLVSTRNVPVSGRNANFSDRYEALFSANVAPPITPDAPGQIEAPSSNCDARGESFQLETNVQRLEDLAGAGQTGFSGQRFVLRDKTLAIDSSGTPRDDSEIPTAEIAGAIGKRGAEFFMDIERLSTFQPNGLQASRDIQSTVKLWREDGKYQLDATMIQWRYSYASNPNDPLNDVFSPAPAQNQLSCEGEGEEHCIIIGLIPMAVLDDPFQFELCYEVRFNTDYSRVFRLDCTKHSFDGTFAGISKTEGWAYPPRGNPGRNIVDFQHLYQDGTEQ